MIINGIKQDTFIYILVDVEQIRERWFVITLTFVFFHLLIMSVNISMFVFHIEWLLYHEANHFAELYWL